MSPALVIVNAVPLLPGYRWHRTARIWRTAGLGELMMGTTNRFTLSLFSPESNVTPGPMPGSWVESVMSHFDQGTQRAILRLYRSSPSEVLERAGERLSELHMPALVAWGMHDPYIPSRFGRDYAAILPDAELVEYPDAGHWAWLDRPDLIDRWRLPGRNRAGRPGTLAATPPPHLPPSAPLQRRIPLPDPGRLRLLSRSRSCSPT